MRALLREMRDRGYDINYRRAIVEGLDTSPEARQQRRLEQGYYLPQYHASGYTQPWPDGAPPARPFTSADSNQPFRAFRDPIPSRDGYVMGESAEMGNHTASLPETANHRLVDKQHGRDNGGYVMPLYMRTGAEFEMGDAGWWANPGDVVATLKRHGVSDRQIARELEEAAYAGGMPDWPTRFRDVLRRHGISTVRYKNEVEGPESEISRMAMEDGQLRSRHAMFNRRRSHKKDMLAALALALASQLANQRSAESSDT